MKELTFIESICFKNGKYQLIPLHQERIFRTFSHFFELKNALILDKVLPPIEESGIFKVRIVYNQCDFKIEVIPYLPKPINSLEVVEATNIDYSFKYENREVFKKLKQHTNSDEIIISKNGFITDSSYANLAFWDGENWITSNTPLLNGVKRQFLIATEQISSKTITTKDIISFKKVSLINAMLDLGEVKISIENIKAV